jgi:hypothetical protein
MIIHCFYEKIVWRRIVAVILARLHIGPGAPLNRAVLALANIH